MKKSLILVYPKKISSGYSGDISLALLYLSGCVRASGFCDYIDIFDFNAPLGAGKTVDDLIKTIGSRHEGLTVVGINCLYSAAFPEVRAIAQRIKNEFPNVKTVTGGLHPTLFYNEIMRGCPEIDAVSIGEADADFPNLLRYFFGAAGPDILNNVCLRVNGEIITKTRNNYIRDLDSLPMPGYEFYNFDEYKTDTSTRSLCLFSQAEAAPTYAISVRSNLLWVKGSGQGAPTVCLMKYRTFTILTASIILKSRMTI